MFEDSGELGDHVDDTTTDKPYSLSGSLGFDSGDGDGYNGEIHSAGFGTGATRNDHDAAFQSSMDDISQDYFAALSENQFGIPGGVVDGDDDDDDDDDDGNYDDDNNSSNDDDVDNDAFFDASMNSEFIPTADYIMEMSMGESMLSPSTPTKKTIRFAEDVVFPDGVENKTMVSTQYLFDNLSDDSGVSEESLDLFGTNLKDELFTASSASVTSIDSGSVISDEDESVDAVKEEERRLVRSMMYAGFGAGFFAFVGWGFGKIMNRVRSSNDVDIGADVAETAIDTAANQASEAVIHAASEAAMQGTEQVAFNASMTASSGNMSTFAGAPFPNGGMTGPQ